MYTSGLQAGIETVCSPYSLFLRQGKLTMLPDVTLHAWDVHTFASDDGYNFFLHHIAIEISWKDRLRQSPNIVRSLSIFSVVILQYRCVVTMFV